MQAQKMLKPLALTEQAILDLKVAAEEERKLTHAKHINEHYRKAIDELEVLMTGYRAMLTRYKAVGR